jgi:ParB-like nuclease domain
MIGPCAPRSVPPVSEDLDSDLLPGDSQAAVLVDVGLLLAADSPRLEGESLAHACMLAGLGAALPPIVVHRDTMRVIDGMHRLRAAVLRGDANIEARFFDGTAEAAFIAGVEANIAHGLPLSVADREAAAGRILGSHPKWSDRAVVASAGLDARTVGAIRRATEDLPQLDRRVGRDGRVRPLDVAAGRRRPGVSVGTARGGAIPPPCTYLVAEIALGCAAAWEQLAAELQQPGKREPSDS